jgi:hypothetical protein
LGINQGLTWSTTVIMKIDLVGPRRRGFAMGLNEFAGYAAVAVPALSAPLRPVTLDCAPARRIPRDSSRLAGLLLSLVRARHRRSRATRDSATRHERHAA